MNAVAQRLQEGRRRAAGDLVEWRCRSGRHSAHITKDAIDVRCGPCDRDPLWKRSTQMKRVDLHPTWGCTQEEDADGE